MDNHKTKVPVNVPDSCFNIGSYIKEGFNLVKSSPVPFIVGNFAMFIINSIAMGFLIGHSSIPFKTRLTDNFDEEWIVGKMSRYEKL